MEKPLHQKTFPSASNPWVARYFENALVLLDELGEAADLSDFSPDCISDADLRRFIDRFREAWTALPDRFNDSTTPPLELVVLCQALSQLEDFLELEESHRHDSAEYAAECKGANEIKRYWDEHDGAWPPEVLGGKANG